LAIASFGLGAERNEIIKSVVNKEKYNGQQLQNLEE